MQSIDLESLIRDDEWMRRLARGLLRDAHDADDVVQEAWVAELERGGAGVGRRRGWLGGVVRHRAYRRVRRERVLRERALDARSERPEEAARSAAEEAADRDVKRLVAVALLDLEDDLRTAVHLTYLADLSTREVAARTGVSPTAVRKRLARAHDELRRRLEKEPGAEGGGWATALVPFLRPGGPEPVAPLAGHRHRAPLSMRPLELAAVAAIVLTVTASYSLLNGSSPSPGGAVTRTVEDPTSSVSGGSGARVTPPATGLAAGRLAKPGPGAVPDVAVIRGRLETPSGEPLGEGTWTLTGPSGRETVDSGELGPGGLLWVEIEAPERSRSVLRVESLGLATEVFDFDRLRGGQEHDLGVIRMRQESILRCRFVDLEGEPVRADPRWVTVFESMTYSGGWRGSLRLRGIGVAEAEEVVVRGLGPGVYRVDPTVRGSNETLVGIGLGEEVLHHCVIDRDVPRFSSVRATPRARLQLTPRHPGLFRGTIDPACVSAVDGNGESVAVVGTGRGRRGLHVMDDFAPPLTVSVDDPRFEFAEREGIRSGHRAHLRLVGTSSLELDVRNDEGEVVDRYAVRVEPAEGLASNGVDLHDGTTVLEGGRIDGLYAGIRLRVIVTTETHRGEALVANAPAGSVTAVAVVLSPLTSVHGTVTHADGRPAAFMDVTLTRPAEVDDSPESRYLPVEARTGDPENCRRAVASVRTDGTGRYLVAVPTPDDYLLRIANGTGLVAWSDVVSVQESSIPLDVVMPRGATVRGHIDLPDWIEPRDLYVRAQAKDASVNFRETPAGRIDSNGNFRLVGQPPGPLDLYLEVNRNTRYLPEGAAMATVELEEGETVTVDCQAASSMPAQVRLLPEGVDRFPDTWSLTKAFAAPGKLFTGSVTAPAPSGAAMVGPFLVAPGDWQFFASGADWAVLDGPTHTIAPGTRLDIRVAAGMDLPRRRFTLGFRGAPLRPDDVRIALAGATNRGGSVSFDPDDLGGLEVALPPGQYEISAFAAGNHQRTGGTATITWPVVQGAVIELR